MSWFEVGGIMMALVVGSMFAFLGWGSWNHNRHRARRGVVTSGVIVAEKVKGVAGPDVGVYGFPVVEFTDAGGQVRRFTHPAGTNIGPTIGRSVPVWYDPENPEEAPVIHGEAAMTAFPYLFMVVGGLAVTGALAVVVLNLA